MSNIIKIGKIQICDNMYSLTVEDNIGDHGTTMGETCFSDRWIKIHSRMHRDNIIATIAHEIAHNVFSEGGAISAMTTDQQEVACNISGKVAEIMFKHIKIIDKTIKISKGFK